MNTNTIRLQGVKSTELLSTKRLMAASIRSIPTVGGRYACRASHRSNNREDEVPTARSMTVEVVSTLNSQTCSLDIYLFFHKTGYLPCFLAS
jgi:hypothetical protein